MGQGCQVLGRQAGLILPSGRCSGLGGDDFQCGGGSMPLLRMRGAASGDDMNFGAHRHDFRGGGLGTRGEPIRWDAWGWQRTCCAVKPI
jgi:hypothetical protein